MGKMLGIRPPSSANRTGELRQADPQAQEISPWSRYSLHKREAGFLKSLQMLHKGSPENRRKAANEVMRQAHLADSPQAKKIISDRLESERVAFVRAHLLRVVAAMSKSGIDCKEFLPRIRVILSEGSDFEKMESAHALRQIGDRASVPPLAQALESGGNMLPPAKRAIRDAIDSLSEGGEGEECPSIP